MLLFPTTNSVWVEVEEREKNLLSTLNELKPGTLINLSPKHYLLESSVEVSPSLIEILIKLKSKPKRKRFSLFN